MAHYKIQQNDVLSRKYAMIGLVPYLGDYYLDEGDIGFERYRQEFYVQAKIIPKEGYERAKGLEESINSFIAAYSIPPFFVGSNKELLSTREMEIYLSESILYKEWYEKLPTEMRYEPFVTQLIVFETHQVDNKENILFCFDLGLEIAHQNWLGGENKSFCEFTKQKRYEPRIQEYKDNLVEKESVINLAYAKSVADMSVDFTALAVAEGYRVRK